MCGALSAFVQTITSPTFAVTGSGLYLKSLISTATVVPVAPASATFAQAAADDAAGEEPPALGAAADGVAAGELHAPRASTVQRASSGRANLRMGDFSEGVGRSSVGQLADDTTSGGNRFCAGIVRE